MTVRVICGDCLDVLPTLPADSVDAVCCDPPYHLTAGKKGGTGLAGLNPNSPAGRSRISTGFMGKAWDGGDVAFRPETWAEVLRVLKPGAHLVAFGAPRNYHRMACAIEDAGFEIRDSLMWLFGSGFPKSHDVGKAIDKAAGAEREVVGANPNHRTVSGVSYDGIYAGGNTGAATVTVPATDAAREWQGWGTALKPAYEPIILARKPLGESTIAANVLRHGCGALNIDGCRITVGQRPDEDAAWESDRSLCDSCAKRAAPSGKHTTPETRASSATRNAAPILSGKDGPSRPATSKVDTGCFAGTTADITGTSLNIGASGPSAVDRSQLATMFTTSMATDPITGSKTCNVCRVKITPQNTRSTRHQQNGEQPTQRGRASTEPQGRWPANCLHDGSEEVLRAFPPSDGGGDMHRRSSPKTKGVYGAFAGDDDRWVGYADAGSAARFFYTSKADAADRLGSKHPTVKPVDLIAYLCRLITPPGGTVLDPFAGSGTTATACMREGFKAILIEREAEYVTDIRRRLAHVSGQDAPLFARTESGDAA